MKCSIARYFSFCLFLLVKKRFSHLSWLTQVLCLSLYDCPSIGLISTMCVFQLFILVMGPRPGLARARPGACPFFRAWAQNFEKGPDSTQARARHLEKGLENLRFYEVKSRGPSRLGLDFVWRAWAWAQLELDFQDTGASRVWSFRPQPITSLYTNRDCRTIFGLENQKHILILRPDLGRWILEYLVSNSV